jgi:uncharacterized membrane protein YjgN (DUF898 family)
MKKTIISGGKQIRKRGFLKLVPFFCWFIILQLTLFSLPQIASAALWDDQEGMEDVSTSFGVTSSAPRDIRVIIAQVIGVFLGLLGILFLALIVLAGYKWMMAQGDSSKVDEAKEQLRTSAIGLVIILAAWGITIFVLNSILKATDPNYIWPI